MPPRKVPLGDSAMDLPDHNALKHFAKKRYDIRRFKAGREEMMAFVQLLEQASPTTRQLIISDVSIQDPAFLDDAMRKIVFFEELIYLEEGVLAEILAASPMIPLAYAIHGMEQNIRQSFLKLVGFRELQKLKDEDERIGNSPAPLLIHGAQKQILKIARKLEKEGRFVIDPHNSPRFQKKREFPKKP